MTGVLLLLLHVPVALALSRKAALRPQHTQQLAQATAEGMPWGPPLSGKTLVVLNTPNYFAAVVSRWLLHPPGPAAVLTLCSSTDEVSVHRKKANEFEIVPDGGFLKEPWSSVVRPEGRPFQLGYRVAVGPFWVEVTELTRDGRPKRLLVAGPHLDDDSNVYCYWESSTNRCQVTSLPAVGKTLVIPAFSM